MLSPIMPLSKGHLSLILASGMLDGRVELATGTVVVKAISTKEDYRKSEQTEIHGGIKFSAIVTAERPKLKLRVLSQDGKITEYS